MRNEFIRKIAGLAMVFSVGSFAVSSQAQFSFFDTFDAETVGAFPSTWTNTTPVSGGTAALYVTNNTASSLPNSFELGTDGASNWRVDRRFANIPMNTVSQIVYSFRINVQQVSPGFSTGQQFELQNFNQTGQLFANFRMLGNTSGGSNTWSVINQYAGISGGNSLIANNLNLNQWYHWKFEIDPSPTNHQTGQVRWYLDNVLINTENIVTVSALATNINTVFIHPVNNQANPTILYLDDFYFAQEIPEPTSTLLVIASACGAIWVARRRLRG